MMSDPMEPNNIPDVVTLKNHIREDGNYIQILYQMNARINEIRDISNEEKRPHMLVWSRFDHLIRFGLSTAPIENCNWCACEVFIRGSYEQKLAVAELFGLEEDDLQYLNGTISASLFPGTVALNWRSIPLGLDLPLE